MDSKKTPSGLKQPESRGGESRIAARVKKRKMVGEGKYPNPAARVIREEPV